VLVRKHEARSKGKILFGISTEEAAINLRTIEQIREQKSVAISRDSFRNP
jgi:hypothetical protein